MDTKVSGFLCVSDLMRSFSTTSNNQCTDNGVLTQYNQHTAQNSFFKAALQCALEIT